MVGMIGRKIGMSQLFDDVGRLTPVTVIEMEPNVVLDMRSEERHGYQAVVISAGAVKPRRLSKPKRGQFESRALDPRRHIVEFRNWELGSGVGDTVDISIFNDILYVDIAGFTKGRGYQGVIKRHGFSGGNKTHGSKFHRAGGSTGMSATPSRVHKGTKMPGRMGQRRVTVQNLYVVRIDTESNLMMVRGAVPGISGSPLIVLKATKKG